METQPASPAPPCPADVAVSDIAPVWEDTPRALRSRLLRYDLKTVVDVLRMPPKRFAELRGVGRKRVDALLALQTQLGDWVMEQSGEGCLQDACAGVASESGEYRVAHPPLAPDTRILEVPIIRDRYPAYLVRTLSRLGIRSARAIAELSSVHLVTQPGIGAGTLRAFARLQSEAQGMLCGVYAVPLRITLASPSEPSEDTDGQATGAVPPYLAEVAICDLVPVWEEVSGGLRNSLARLGLRTVTDILRMDAERFAELRSVGHRRVEEFSALQTRLREYVAREAEGLCTEGVDTSQGGETGECRVAYPPLPADTRVLEVPIIRDRYPAYLVRTLNRLGIKSARAITELPSDRLVTQPGMGAGTLRAFARLQSEAQAMLRGEYAVPVTVPSSTAPEEVETTEAGPLPPDYAEVAVSDVWSAWRRVPGPLRRALVRHGLRTVADVFSVTPEQFCEWRLVGRQRAGEFAELQEYLRAWLVRMSEKEEVQGSPSTEGHGKAIYQTATVPSKPEWSSLHDLLADAAMGVDTGRRGAANNHRNSRLWLNRFGLAQQRVPTLSELGNAHGMTKERVRQIVDEVTVWVRQEFRGNQSLVPFLNELDAVFGQCLGVARIPFLANALQTQMRWSQAPTARQIRVLGEILAGSPHSFAVDQEDGLARHVAMCHRLWQRTATEARRLLREVREDTHILYYVHRLCQVLQNGCGRRETRHITIVPCCGAGTDRVCLPEEYVRAVLSSFAPDRLDGEIVLGAEERRCLLPSVGR